jgi:hypothetical protein
MGFVVSVGMFTFAAIVGAEACVTAICFPVGRGVDVGGRVAVGHEVDLGRGVRVAAGKVT